MDQLDQIAVLIDFENLVLGAEESLPGHSNPVPYAAIELLCSEHGNAAVRRAYANWASHRFNRFQEDLALNGVDLIHVTRFGVQRKNAADVRMAVDAMELLITHPDVTVFILVAGDGDYSPLVQRLREFGKHVIGVGTEASASRRLVSVCSEYKYWATLVAQVDPAARRAAEAEFSIEAATRLLRTAVAKSPQPVLAAPLKNKMLSIDPSFDERNYGCDNFRDFLTRMNHVVDVSTEDDRDLAVSLREGTPHAPSTPSQSLSRPDDAPHPLAAMRLRGVDMPLKPESRDALLSSVHDAWRDGRLTQVGDIGNVLLDEETRFVPKTVTRQTITRALVYKDSGVSIALAEEPDEERPLMLCRLVEFDGSDCDDWTQQAHVGWLAWVMYRMRSYPNLDQVMVETFFADCEDYGRELVPRARKLSDDRWRSKLSAG